MLRKWFIPLMALLIVACGQQSQQTSVELVDSTAPGAKYTLVHAGAPW